MGPVHLSQKMLISRDRDKDRDRDREKEKEKEKDKREDKDKDKIKEMVIRLSNLEILKNKMDLG